MEIYFKWINVILEKEMYNTQLLNTKITYNLCRISKYRLD